MKKLALIFSIILISAYSFSQIEKMREEMDDEDAEVLGMLSLRFINAENGDPVTITEGDMVFFPQGMKCVWKIIEPIEKHYIYE